jgi:hypothetical protein
MNDDFAMNWSFGPQNKEAAADRMQREEERIEALAHIICDGFDTSGTMTLPALVGGIKDTDAPEVCMAVCWLAKAGTVVFDGKGLDSPLVLRTAE